MRFAEQAGLMVMIHPLHPPGLDRIGGRPELAAVAAFQLGPFSPRTPGPVGSPWAERLQSRSMLTWQDRCILFLRRRL